jgi:hypothetical protein
MQSSLLYSTKTDYFYVSDHTRSSRQKDRKRVGDSSKISCIGFLVSNAKQFVEKVAENQS